MQYRCLIPARCKAMHECSSWDQDLEMGAFIRDKVKKLINFWLILELTIIALGDL